MEELQKLVYAYEGIQMVTIEVARMKEPDSFGRTHTAYARVEVPQGEVKLCHLVFWFLV